MLTRSSHVNEVFDRSGLASTSDLTTETWKRLFTSLEEEQAAFLEKDHLFRSKDYIWPKDALHSWSRVWEYPYVYHHLKKSRGSTLAGQQPVVVDLGSGATFFPFAVAHLGYRAVCVDTDPASEESMKRAVEYVPCAPGKVDFRLSDGIKLPLSDGEADVLYCISVMEHIPDFEKTILEITRVLKPNGLFLLTFDIDLLGNSQIGILEYQRLYQCLRDYFELLCPEMTVHPKALLHSKTGPYPLLIPRRVSYLRAVGLGWLAERLFGRLVYGGSEGVHLAVQGMVLSKGSRVSA